MAVNALGAPNAQYTFGTDIFPFSANGNGTGNDAPAINSAAAIATATGATLVGGNRVYRITDQVRLPLKHRGFVFDASAYTTSSLVATGVNGIYPVVCVGTDIWASTYPTIAVTSSITRGDSSIVVGATSTLSPGDVVLVHESTAWSANFSAGKKSEVKTVDSVDSSTGVTFTSPIECSYTTAATVRKYAAEEACSSDIKVLGCGGTTVAMTGLAYVNLRRVAMSGAIEVSDCPKAGVIAFNCAQVTGAYIGVKRALLAGFSYAFQNAGCSNVSISRVYGENVRHVVTNGNGVGGGQMCRNVSYGIVEGSGCRDAIFDCHPPVADIQVGMVMGTCGGTDASAGDGLVCQGSRLQIGSVNIYGFRRHGILLQPYGDGDGVEPSFSFGKVFLRGLSTSQYGIEYLDTSATGATYIMGGIHIGHLDSETGNGSYVTASVQKLRRLEISGGRSVSLGASTNGIRVQNTSPGTVDQVVLSGTEFVATPTTSTKYAVYIQGDAGNTILARILGCSLLNGVYNLRSDYSTVRVDVDYSGSTTGTVFVGTGGTVTAAQYA